MSLETILKLATTIIAFLGTVIPLVITLVRKGKELKQARTEAEKLKAIAELKDVAKTAIEEAENTYKDVNAILKSQGKSCGLVKKDTVLSKLRLSATELKLSFDEEFWSKEVDELVVMTKKVNC